MTSEAEPDGESGTRTIPINSGAAEDYCDALRRMAASIAAAGEDFGSQLSSVTEYWQGAYCNTFENAASAYITEAISLSAAFGSLAKLVANATLDVEAYNLKVTQDPKAHLSKPPTYSAAGE